MNLENIMLNEVKSVTKDHKRTTIRFHLYKCPEQANLWRWKADQLKGGGEWRMTPKGHIISFHGNENILKLSMEMAVQLLVLV